MGLSGGGEWRGFLPSLIAPKSGTSKALTIAARYRNGGTMNGLLAICSICREIIS